MTEEEEVRERKQAARRSMMKRRRRTLLVILVALVGGIAWQTLRTTSPQDTVGASQRGPVAGADETGTVQGADRKLPIKHIVFIVKENRSFDNYFARYPGAEGAKTGKTSTGEVVELSEATDVVEPDLGHGFFDAIHAINGGRMDGFDRVYNGETLNGYSSFTRR